jgi:hypothetical protein
MLFKVGDSCMWACGRGANAAGNSLDRRTAGSAHVSDTMREGLQYWQHCSGKARQHCLLAAVDSTGGLMGGTQRAHFTLTLKGFHTVLLLLL